MSRPPVHYRQPRFSIPESDRRGAISLARAWRFRITERGITLQRVPIQPRAPQAVPAHEPDYVIYCPLKEAACPESRTGGG